MVIRIGAVVHAEGRVYVTDVGNVVDFLEGLADELRRSLETLPHVGTYVRSEPHRKFASKYAEHQVKRKVLDTFEEESLSFFVRSDGIKLDSCASVRQSRAGILISHFRDVVWVTGSQT